MRVIVELAGETLDLQVDNADGATVGDLVRAIGQRGHRVPADPVVQVVQVGRPVTAPADHGLAEVGIRDGTQMRIRPAGSDVDRARSAAPASPGARMVVVAGLDAGRTVEVPPGRHPVGRGPGGLLAHPTVSVRHAAVTVGLRGEVAACDLGSRNGTWVDGQPAERPRPVTADAWLRVGAQLVRTGDASTGVAGDGGLVQAGQFHRPPPASLPGPPAAVRRPSAASGAGSRPSLGLASLLGSVAMGAVMLVMSGNLLYALMAFVTPVVGLGSGWMARRRYARDERRRRHDQQAIHRRFEADVAAAVDAQRAALRARNPDPAEVVRRATTTSRRLWERRPGADGLLRVTLGYATVAWRPTLVGGDGLVGDGFVGDASGGPAVLRDSAGAGAADPVEGVLRRHGWLVDAPVATDLDGEVVGIVGARHAALALARWLVCEALVHQGPADLELVLTSADPHAAFTWDWVKWVPHLAGDDGRLRVGLGDPAARALLAAQVDAGAPPSARRRLVVMDGVEPTQGRDAPGRAVLRLERTGGIVVAERVEALPAACTTIVRLDGQDGAAHVERVDDGSVVGDVLVCGVTTDTARRIAVALAGLQDPERDTASALPARVDLARLLADRPSGQAGLPVVLGQTVDGPLVIDLERDGPHALVAGTTGSGKSELLRSMVAGLAAQASPDRVTFVLVDYKGGSAFDACAALPHVVGLVTDLDDGLAQRALTCLRAELEHRESVLRCAGAPDLRAYRRLAVAREEPLPSLVVCIDEFAAMAAELPDFLNALVGIAQRGRSLGVHLVLATQRPSGVVSDDIRANTNLRIALRVQDRQDSTDVIEVADAALLPRDRPGRALVRLGPGELIAVQTALVTGRSRPAGGALTVAPFGLGSSGPVSSEPELSGLGSSGPGSSGLGLGCGEAGVAGTEPGAHSRTDLDRLVDAARAGWEASGRPTPRVPWPPPLPTDLTLDELRGPAEDAMRDAAVVVGLVDEPARQRQVPGGWDLDAGNLLLTGIAGSGTTTTLASLAVTAARATPTPPHLYVIDAGSGALAPLADLASCGAVVALSQEERVRRLVDRLHGEVERRRSAGHGPGQRPKEPDPRVVLLIDGYDRLVAAHELGDDDLLARLDRVVVDGPSVGVHAALAVARPAAVPPRLASTIGQRWVFRLADPADTALLGAPAVAGLPPGRCVVAATGLQMQVGHPGDLGALMASAPTSVVGTARAPAPIEVLPGRVAVGQLPPPTCPVDGGPWRLPVGVRGDDLGTGAVVLHPGEQALVTGAARSGRSTLLASLALVAAAAGVELALVAPRGGPLADVAVALGLEPVAPGALAGLLNARAAQPGAGVGPVAAPEAVAGQRSLLVLVDDADLIDEPGLGGALARLGPACRLVAAARADAVRAAYGSWLRDLVRARVGVLLDPDPDLDGDLFGVRLPRRPTAPPAPGRGWLAVAGRVVQLQTPAPAPARASSRAPAPMPGTASGTGRAPASTPAVAPPRRTVSDAGAGPPRR